MVIGLDLDGTAWDFRFFFSEIMSGLQARGHKVGILTSHNGDKLKKADLHLFKSRGFPKPDFYIAKTKQEASIPPREWKPAMMDKHGIGYLFDDFDSKTIEVIIKNKTVGDQRGKW